MASNQSTRQAIRGIETMAVDLPIVGHVNLPRPEEPAKPPFR